MIQAPRFAVVMVVGGLMACGGGGPAQSPDARDPVVEVIPPGLLALTWPVRLANDQARAPFEADRGWQWLFQREYPGAMKAFKRSGNAEGIARVHLEYALLYRQAARLGANATVQAYGTDRQDTDPDEMAYFVAVSEALIGKKADGTAHLDQVAVAGALASRVDGWRAALAGEGTMPASLSDTEALVGGLAPVEAGHLLKAPAVPHFTFLEKTPQRRPLGANDPTALLAMAQWHDAAVLDAMPTASVDALAKLRAPWLLPAEPQVASTDAEIPDGWLFARGLLSAEDVAFVADLRRVGPGAMADWSQRSPLAAAIAPAWDGQKVDPQIVMDRALSLMKQGQAAMAVASGGESAFHRPFALFVRLGVLIAGMELADAADQYRDAGILRLEALERMGGGAGGIERDPVFAMSVAAWDAGNRSPLRPEDIVHDLLPEFPGIEAARAPLDALHLRRSRNAAPSSPVH